MALRGHQSTCFVVDIKINKELNILLSTHEKSIMKNGMFEDSTRRRARATSDKVMCQNQV